MVLGEKHAPLQHGTSNYGHAFKTFGFFYNLDYVDVYYGSNLTALFLGTEVQWPPTLKPKFPKKAKYALYLFRTQCAAVATQKSGLV